MRDRKSIEEEIEAIKDIKQKASNIVNSCDQSLNNLKWELFKVEDMENQPNK